MNIPPPIAPPLPVMVVMGHTVDSCIMLEVYKLSIVVLCREKIVSLH